MELLRCYWRWPVVLVLVHFGMNGCFGCWEQERIALLQFKASINHASELYEFSLWDSGNKVSDCCEWERVKCNITTRRVIQLTLDMTLGSWSSDVRGHWYFNASMFLPFEELQYLDLSYNSIPGWIPNEGFERFSALSKLEVLHLDYNNFNNSILQSFSGTIASLKELDLSFNKWNGSIHIQVMTSLNKLGMRSCELKGTLPTQDWCDLKNLQEIDLSENKLEGILPSCMVNFTSLNILDLSYNHFNGNIVQSPLSSLSSLEYLSFSNNSFFIPSTFSFLFNLSNLKILLSDNNILALEPDSLTLIPTFQLKVLSLSNCSINIHNRTPPRFLHYQYDLRVINLSHNKLVGQFPYWLIENNTRLEIFIVNNNSFMGPFMVPYDIRPNMLNIDISDNYLHGPIPTNLGLIFPNLESLRMS
ncbi:receptor-like protein 8 [Quercus lobata]|uniref:receptor-like protein 8 n=1 Tax=Quercus lobata TaxID=97700 RepID=UPI001244F228|nr:receptor-like protein 8 [Quercus lobata]